MKQMLRSLFVLSLYLLSLTGLTNAALDDAGVSFLIEQTCDTRGEMGGPGGDLHGHKACDFFIPGISPEKLPAHPSDTSARLSVVIKPESRAPPHKI